MHSVPEQQEDFGIEQQAFQDLERDFQEVTQNQNPILLKSLSLLFRSLMNYPAIQA